MSDDDDEVGVDEMRLPMAAAAAAAAATEFDVHSKPDEGGDEVDEEDDEGKARGKDELGR